MNAAMPKLKPRDLFFIVVGLCLIALVMWYFLRFQARQQEIQAVQTSLDDADTRLATLQGQQAQLPQLRTDVRALEQEQEVFVRALPSTVKMGQVIRDVQDSASAAGGKIDGITVASSAEANLPAGVQAVNLNVNVQGRFAPTFRTLRSVETMGRFSKITSVNMTLPAPNDTDPNLNSVINMTVYTFDPGTTQATPAGEPGAAPTTPNAPSAPAGGNS
ncbi:pilus assembly protein PilO [Deinococcus psychrotolerans]|uniref:Pilus assembly protein PilO n=1 Tax=Deinococcus psychrotolerans TaxID=2489213 RepID=A0A3G8YBI0_9DEIO|nr:type 4a pilus biogenesis protein PilO [Deinococcus psychrotolerans]AZI42722.1 pilus assembly protein PilO [Deinococcus psychrotolerans]